MNKSELTRNKILREGMLYAAQFGLLSVTIGEMAKVAKMSRTGVISHFSNKEDMQIAIMVYAEAEFVERVLKPAYSENALENLQQLKYHWLNWMTRIAEDDAALGCPFIKASVEYQERDKSSIRAFMQDQQKRLLEYLGRLIDRCIEQGYLYKTTDKKKFCYEYYSLYLGHCIQQNLGNTGLTDIHFYAIIDDLIERNCIRSEA